MIKSGGGILDSLRRSSFHMRALEAVRTLGLPSCWIAAGFVRNHVWDLLHGYARMTPLNDIDVVYFDAANQNEDFEKEQERRLSILSPGLPWSVKNQARMHVRNGEAPYGSVEVALSRWCETVTPVGACLGNAGTLSLISPLGLDDLLGLECRATPWARSNPAKLRDYRDRMRQKQWKTAWPQLTIHDMD